MKKYIYYKSQSEQIAYYEHDNGYMFGREYYFYFENINPEYIGKIRRVRVSKHYEEIPETSNIISLDEYRKNQELKNKNPRPQKPPIPIWQHTRKTKCRYLIDSDNPLRTNEEMRILYEEVKAREVIEKREYQRAYRARKKAENAGMAISNKVVKKKPIKKKSIKKSRKIAAEKKKIYRAKTIHNMRK